VVAAYSNVICSASDRKLISDVDSLNRSVIAHIATGADLSTLETAEEVLTTLKQSFSDAARLPGFSGSKIDERLSFSIQSDSEAKRKGKRAFWSPADQRFVLSDTGPAGIKGFTLDDNAVPKELTTTDPKTPLLYAKDGSWIWDYKDASPSLNPGPSVIPLDEVPDTIPVPPSRSGTSSPSSVTPLIVPSFSIASGSFPINTFDLPLTLTNPNPSGSSDLYYSLDYGNWQEYSGPLTVKPGTIVAAQAIARSQLYSNSARVDQTYLALSEDLLSPVISPSRPDFGIFTGRAISVSLTNLNPGSISKLQYRVGGDPWQDYSGPFTLAREGYPSGALVQARAVPIDPNYVASAATLRTLGVESASIAGTSVGTFSNPIGENRMETNLTKGRSSDYFEWGSDSAGNSNSQYKKSWLNYDGAAFTNITPGERFQIGTLDYFNGTIQTGTGATGVSFAVDLSLALNGATTRSAFIFDLDLVNVQNKGGDEWGSADYVRLANPTASQIVTFNGIQFQLQLEFGETSASGISYFNEFHVLESDRASTRIYGNLIEVGSIHFNR